MNNFISLQRQQGVGLIEVVIAVALFSFAFLAISEFQGTLLHSTSASKDRAIAAQLADQKLNDLRTFSSTNTGNATGTFIFTEIGANTGGQENADGTLVLASGTVTVGNTQFTRSWTSTDYYYCSENSAPTTTACSGADFPSFKQVAVTVSWTETDGTTQTLVTNGTLHSTSLDAATLVQGADEATTAFTPTVSYTPGLAPDVLPVSIGDGQTQETSKPKPQISTHANSTPNTIASFETVKYDTNDSNRTLSREEFVTIDCRCEYAGSASTTNIHGNKVTKVAGIPAEFSTSDFTAVSSIYHLELENGLQQHKLCVKCCADHHDYYSSTDKDSCNPAVTNDATVPSKADCVDPFRPTSDYGTDDTKINFKDHKHYSLSGSTYVLADEVGEEYLEACRFQRINGEMELQQDWNLIKLDVFPKEALSDDSTGGYVDQFSDYINDYLSWYFTQTGTEPVKPAYTLYNLRPGQTTEYLARGVYLDYLTATEKSAIATSFTNNDTDTLQNVPFYEVNMTKLSEWTSSAPATATVSSEAIVDENTGENNYSRGEITVQSGAASGASVTIQASAKMSNTGLLGVTAIDSHDNSVIFSDSETFTIDAGFSITGVISGSMFTGNTKVADTTLTISTGGNCGAVDRNGNYSCAIPANWTGTLSPSHAEVTTFTPAQYVVSSPAASSLTQNFVASASITEYTISGTISGPPSWIMADIVMTPSSGGSCTAPLTDGSYSCTVTDGWSGEITPTLTDATFSPAVKTYSSVSGDSSGNDYSATYTPSYSDYNITGTISGTPTPQATVLSITSPGSCQAVASDGTYTCTVTGVWTGSITPSLSGYSFAPTSHDFSSSLTADASGKDFTATADAPTPVTYVVTVTLWDDAERDSKATNRAQNVISTAAVSLSNGTVCSTAEVAATGTAPNSTINFTCNIEVTTSWSGSVSVDWPDSMTTDVSSQSITVSSDTSVTFQTSTTTAP